MKLLKSLFYSALLGLSVPAMVSCDGDPIDNSGGVLGNFNLVRFDVAAITAAPGDVAPVPLVMKSGDTFSFVAGLTERADESVFAEPYEAAVVINGTRQLELVRRPAAIGPVTVNERLASWTSTGFTATSGTFATTEQLDQTGLDTIIAAATINSSGSLQSNDFREALRNNGQGGTNTVESAEDIVEGFQDRGFDAFYNENAYAGGGGTVSAGTVYIVVRREIKITSTGLNSDLVDPTNEITGTYEVIEYIRKLKFVENNGGFFGGTSEFLTVEFDGNETAVTAETGTFTLDLNGLSGS